MTDAGVPPAAAGARRVTVPAPRLSRWLDGVEERHGALRVQATADVVHIAAGDDTEIWIDVPFPPLQPAGPAVLASLIAHVEVVRTVGVILVRRGGSAVGVFRGTELIASKIATSYVQGTTKAGGWSQQRYARRRANQSKAAFAGAADVAVAILLPRVSGLAAVFGGGDRAAVAAVLADARLAALRPLVAAPVLDVPDPRLRILQRTPEQFRAVHVRLSP